MPDPRKVMDWSKRMSGDGSPPGEEAGMRPNWGVTGPEKSIVDGMERKKKNSGLVAGPRGAA